MFLHTLYLSMFLLKTMYFENSNEQLLNCLQFHSQTLNYKLDLVGGRFLRINQVVDRVEHRTPPAMPECKFGAAQKFFSHELPTFFSRILLAIGVCW